MDFTLTPDECAFVVIAGCFIVFDVLTGIVKALATRTLNSQTGREGLFHKMGFVLVICLGVLCHLGQQAVDLGIHFPLLQALCAYVIFNEVVSSVENIGVINPSLQGSRIMQLFDFARDQDVRLEEERHA